MAINKAARHFLVGSLTSALVVSLLPVWKTWFVSSWEEVGDKGTLFSAISYLPRQTQDFGVADALLRYHFSNLVLLAAVLVAGGIAAMYLGGKINRRS